MQIYLWLNGMCKVGMAKSTKERVRTLQTSNPRWRLMYSSPEFAESKARNIEHEVLSSLRNKYGSVHLESGRKSELIYCSGHDAITEVINFINQDESNVEQYDFIISEARNLIGDVEINPVLSADNVIKLNSDFELHRGHQDQDGNYYRWNLVFVPDMEDGVPAYTHPIFDLKKFRSVYPVKTKTSENKDGKGAKPCVNTFSVIDIVDYANDNCDKCGYLGVTHTKNGKEKICEVCMTDEASKRKGRRLH